MKLKYYFILFLSMPCAASFAQEQKMQEGEAAAFRQAVVVAAKKITTLSTDFTQYKHMDFLSKDMVTTGTMSFKGPGMLQWQYKTPYKYSIVFKNGKIFINDEGKKSNMDVGNSELFAKINKLIVGSVSGNLFDDNEFAITYFKIKDQNGAVFIPKDPALKKYIRQIELTFNKEDATVTQVKLVESPDDYTLITFKNKVLNARIADSIFTN